MKYICAVLTKRKNKNSPFSYPKRIYFETDIQAVVENLLCQMEIYSYYLEYWEKPGQELLEPLRKLSDLYGLGEVPYNSYQVYRQVIEVYEKMKRIVDEK